MEYPLSYLKGAAVVLDAAPAASSLRNGQVGEVSEAGAVPRPKKRLLGRGPVDFISVEMPAPSSQVGGGSALLSASALHDSVMATSADDDYALSKVSVPAGRDGGPEAGDGLEHHRAEKRSILMIGSLRVDITCFECILRVRSGCYLLPQAGARAIVVVLEIPPKRPTMVENLSGEDEQYVLIESTGENGGTAEEAHPAIEAFESCLKGFANLVAMDEVSSETNADGGARRSSYSEEGEIHGTSLGETDQNHLVKFANSVFAECDHLLVNTSTKQGVAPVLASSIKVTGNILCKTLLTTSNVAGTGVKVFGKALREVIPQSQEEAKVSESTRSRIDTAEWIGEKAVSASDFVVSTTSKAVQYTGKVVSDRILQSDMSKYWTGLDARGAEQNGFFQTMGTILDAMITSAVDLQLAVQKSTWSLLNDLKDTAIDLVDHKYGSDAAMATGKSVSAALNVGSATVSAATVARSASGLAKGVAKESGDQIVSMESWMGGALQMYGVFECKETTRWGQVWGLLRPDALAMYSQTDLVQERPTWIVTIRDISNVKRENFMDAVEAEEEVGDAESAEEEEGPGDVDAVLEAVPPYNGTGAESEYAERGDAVERVPSSKQCKIHLQTRSHCNWSLRFESQESGKRWCEALLRCIRSNARCKLLGCLIDGSEV